MRAMGLLWVTGPWNKGLQNPEPGPCQGDCANRDPYWAQGSAPAEVPPGERRIDTHDREERARDAKGQAAAVILGTGLRVQQWARSQ